VADTGRVQVQQVDDAGLDSHRQVLPLVMSLIVDGDTPNSAASITAHEPLLRLGAAASLFATACARLRYRARRVRGVLPPDRLPDCQVTFLPRVLGILMMLG
jgi:hypothetical protein